MRGVVESCRVAAVVALTLGGARDGIALSMAPERRRSEGNIL